MGKVYKRGKIWYLNFYIKGRRIASKDSISMEISQLALKDAEVKSTPESF